MGQPFTYFHEDGGVSVRRAPQEPPPRPGEIWARGDYASDVLPAAGDVYVGETKAGMKVWMLVHWLRLSENDTNTLRRRFAPGVMDEDIAAAQRFYQRNREEIDRRIAEEIEAA
jgi:hypothetical protein